MDLLRSIGLLNPIQGITADQLRNMPIGQSASDVTPLAGIDINNLGDIAGGTQVGTMGGGLNFDGMKTMASLIGSLGGMYNAFQGSKLAKDSLGFQKRAFETNLTNQTQSYNTALEDRVRSRHVTEGRSAAETDSYLDKNRL